MITIREYSDSVAANLFVSYLEDNEIDPILVDENAAAWSGLRVLVPIRLQVPEDQAETASQLIKDFENAVSEPPI